MLIATDDGVVPTGAVEDEPNGLAAVGCTARLTAAMNPFGEPVPQVEAPRVGQETVFVTVIG